VCGICGIAALEGVDRSALDAMSAALEHRGPDSAGAMVDGPICSRGTATGDHRHPRR
jgi:asparagine synthetase B (glutamine-hydrolysing)